MATEGIAELPRSLEMDQGPVKKHQMRSPRNKNRRGILINAKQKKTKKQKPKQETNQPGHEGPMSIRINAKQETKTEEKKDALQPGR